MSQTDTPTWRDIVSAARRIIEVAIDVGATLACAESCTGGMISSALTSIPGSSAVFFGGIVSYTPVVKHAVLGVSQRVIDSPDEGVVSDACARQMAVGALQVCGARIAVSTTGIAGPSGAEPGKPIGTVYIGRSLAAPGDSLVMSAQRYVFSGSRSAVRLCATQAALAAFYEEIMKL